MHARLQVLSTRNCGMTGSNITHTIHIHVTALSYLYIVTIVCEVCITFFFIFGPC